MNSKRFIVEKARAGPEGGLCWVVWDTVERRQVDWCRTKREATRSSVRWEQASIPQMLMAKGRQHFLVPGPEGEVPVCGEPTYPGSSSNPSETTCISCRSYHAWSKAYEETKESSNDG